MAIAAALSLDKSACVFERIKGSCLHRNDIEVPYLFLTVEGIIDPKTTSSTMKYLNSISDEERAKIVKKTMDLLEITNEADIWTHPKIQAFASLSRKELGAKLSARVAAIRSSRYKHTGPANSTALLDNVNIDKTLMTWAVNAKDMFGMKVKHIPFQMIDFMSTGSELAMIDVLDLRSKGYDSMYCVLNTDDSGGRGIHWFCIYSDLKSLSSTGSGSPPILRIEYFNSSGNPPKPEIIEWIEKLRAELSGKVTVELVKSVGVRIQYSDTECGVWSLIYIRSRLAGQSADWLYKMSDGRTDEQMKRIRSTLFTSKDIDAEFIDTSKTLSPGSNSSW